MGPCEGAWMRENNQAHRLGRALVFLSVRVDLHTFNCNLKFSILARLVAERRAPARRDAASHLAFLGGLHAYAPLRVRQGTRRNGSLFVEHYQRQHFLISFDLFGIFSN